MQDHVQAEGLGLLTFLAVSTIHALRAVAPIEVRPRTGQVIYGLSAAFLIPYLVLAPARAEVQQEFNSLWETLHEQWKAKPPSVEEVLWTQFTDEAATMTGWTEYLEENPGFTVPMMWHVAGAGFGGIGDHAEVNFWYSAATPSRTPGSFDLDNPCCIKVDLAVEIAGNVYMPGELRAVIATHGQEHDDLMAGHLRTILGEFEAVVTDG